MTLDGGKSWSEFVAEPPTDMTDNAAASIFYLSNNI